MTARSYPAPTTTALAEQIREGWRQDFTAAGRGHKNRGQTYRDSFAGEVERAAGNEQRGTGR